jgi:hypothetical protein
MKKTILRNREGEEVAAILSDEKSGRWRIAAKAEPHFKRTLPPRKKRLMCGTRISMRKQESCGNNPVLSTRKTLRTRTAFAHPAYNR